MRISDWSSDVCSSDLVHLRLNLLAHRAAQQIGFAKRIASQYLGGLHHLFLIDEDAVGLAQHRLQQRMRIFDLLQPVLASDAGGDIARKSVVWGTSVTGRVVLGGRLRHKKQTQNTY